MKPAYQRHVIICLFLVLLAVPIYYLDQALLAPKGGGGNWIILDFRGLIFRPYITLLAIYVALSSIAVLLFSRLGALRIHLGSVIVSLVLLVTGFVVYGKVRESAISHQRRALMESRRRLISMIELKEWWYVPDDNYPTEIDVSVVVHDSGRFAGNVTGEETDPSGSSRIVFQSREEPERQRKVGVGEAFTYVFPLEVLHAGHADNISITLYLFKAPSGPATGDIAKVFIKSPQTDDDGEYFYGILPAPSRPGK